MTMAKKVQKKSPSHQKIAVERIAVLFQEADNTNDPTLADRYVFLARKLSMKYKVKLTSGQKRRFCKHCYCYLKPGRNCRVRLQGRKLIYYCGNCKRQYRIPYSKRLKASN